MNKTPIIFDFDGTIADTLPIFLEFARKENVRFDDSDVAKWRVLSLRELVEKLGIPKWKILFIAWKFHRYFRKAASRVPCAEGIIDVIRALRKDGHLLGIVTSNSKVSVRTILAREDALSCFFIIRSEWSVFGKARSLRKIVHRLGVASEAAWYVGDEVRDVEAAHEAGLQSVAVSWGFNSDVALRMAHPSRLASSPSELVGIFR